VLPAEEGQDGGPPTEVQAPPRQLPVCVGVVMCERIIKDAEDGTFSFIRIVDTFNLPAEANNDTNDGIELGGTRLAIMLKSGGAIGKFDVKLMCEKPGEVAVPIGITTAEFTGRPEGGTNIAAAMKFPWHGEGLYWLKVEIDGEVVGRTPFRINIAEAPSKPDDSEVGIS
jgi:hypothetical protein